MSPNISTDGDTSPDLVMADTPDGAMSNPIVRQIAKIIRALNDRFMVQKSHRPACLKRRQFSRLRDGTLTKT